MDMFIPERLLTGIPRIDKEHQSLVELVTWMEGICSVDNASNCLGCILSVRDSCGANLDTLLTTLQAYMQNHFRYEERLMVDWALPKNHIDEHQAAHRAIEKRFADLIDEFSRERNTAATSRKVATELRAWLVEHMDTYDSDLAVYIGSEDHK